MARAIPALALRERLRGFWLNRLPRTDALRLTQRNVYILPTGPGWMLALTLLLLLLASINYQLNLGYLLTFLLAGSALAGMHVAHANLRGITLQLRPPAPVFLGEAAQLPLRLDNPDRRARWGLRLALPATPDPEGIEGGWTDLPAQDSATVTLAWTPPQRGLQTLPAVVAETRFPLGAFRVWAWWRPAAPLLVYPRPEPQAPPLPLGEASDTGEAPTHARAAGEFDGVRAYRRGDTLRQVVWKKAAQALASGSDALVSRDSDARRRQQLWLDEAHTRLVDTEARLSRLTAWVLQAEAQGLRYGLRVGAVEIPPDHGEAQRQRCLEALAKA